MVGNDIVDLGDPETAQGAQHPRFDARVFSDDERALIARCAVPEQVRWLLWAAKESAYKALRQHDAGLGFSPRSLRVRCDGDLRTGTVDADGASLRFDATLAGSYVHVVSREREVAVIGRVVVVRPGEEPSSAVRRLAARMLWPCDPPHVVFETDASGPRASRGGELVEGRLSFSHHGRYAAVAFGARQAPSCMPALSCAPGEPGAPSAPGAPGGGHCGGPGDRPTSR